jgi:hypothetical protein
MLEFAMAYCIHKAGLLQPVLPQELEDLHVVVCESGQTTVFRSTCQIPKWKAEHQ